MFRGTFDAACDSSVGFFLKLICTYIVPSDSTFYKSIIALFHGFKRVFTLINHSLYTSVMQDTQL